MSVNRLGKGLSALIRPEEDQKHTELSKSNLSDIPIKDIVPNPNQPRKFFDNDSLDELSASIKAKGLITPVTVRRTDSGYELIAGERRYRASKKLRKKTIPAYILNAKNDAEIMEMALIENIQRDDLNALEESNAYSILSSKFGMSHDSIAKAVGKKRATISNSLRLLKLPLQIQNSLRKGKITAGHARAILQAKNSNNMLKIWELVLSQDLSVRRTESLVKKRNGKIKKRTPVPKKDYLVQSLENQLIDILGTKVKIRSGKNRGIIEVSYFSSDDLERIIDLINSIS